MAREFIPAALIKAEREWKTNSENKESSLGRCNILESLIG